MTEHSGEPPSGDRGFRPKILVADDEHVIADTLAVILAQAGFETAVAYEGDEAVEKARTFRPDLLLSDVMMPGLNGIKAAIQIRMWIPECKVLLFSGHASTAALLDDARSSGHHFEVLDKPLHPHELLKRLRALEI